MKRFILHRLSAMTVINTLATIVLLCMFAFVAEAHRDMWLKISEDGKISPLPPVYSGTRVEIELSKKQSGKLTKLSFTSAGKTTNIQKCLLDLVPEVSKSQIQLSGSWYHDKTILPDYVSVLFKAEDERSDLPAPTGVEFLFSLEDASLIDVTKSVPVPQERAVQGQKIEFKNGCPILPLER